MMFVTFSEKFRSLKIRNIKQMITATFESKDNG